MAYRYEKETGDLVFEGFEQGIAPSPHKGIANIQNANISTETGELTINYSRLQESQSPILGASISVQNTSHILYVNSGLLLTNGTWITISGSSGTPSNGNYYVFNVSGTSAQSFQISSTFQGSAASGFTGSIGVFSTVNMGQPVQGVTENYTDSSQNFQQRNYILDTNGYLWVNDTAISITEWHMGNSSGDIGTSYGATPSGLAILNGYVLMFVGNSIYYKETVLLGVSWATMTQALNQLSSSRDIHYAITNHSNFVYYTDGNYIGSIIPSSVSSAGNINVWSYGTFTSNGASPSVLSITSLIGGNMPVNGATMTFSNSVGGSLTNVSANTVYYVVSADKTGGTFEVSATVGGTAINSISVSGTGYFNTFDPNSGTTATFTINYQALSLGVNEVAQCMVELDSTLLIGCRSNSIYQWNEVTISTGGTLNLIQLPENNTSSMVQANNVAYIFAGSKGNIYVTNGSSLSLALSVPDYCAGIPGTTTSYIDPVFSWGGSMFLRGRIWFSVLDQTSTKLGNCGGIWSFVPSFFNPVTGQDIGLALRMENTSSYASLNGVCNVLLPSVPQTSVGPQYWSAWSSSISSPIYGIDGSGTIPSVTAILETDLIPIGTLLRKKTPSQIEYKVSSPLLSNENVGLYYRQNSTDAWTSCGILVEESGNRLSGYYPSPTQGNQWIQIQARLIPNGTSTYSGSRLFQIRIR